MMSPIPGPEVPGEETHIGTALLEKVTATIQGFAPINRIHQHQCAAHFYAHDMSRQVVVHHFCAHLNEEIRQCLLYDSPDADARLIGVEYMVSENLFLMLPDEEKKLWHSHEYEVKSGGLVMPGVPGPIERLDLAKICKTYGKAFQFWQVDQGHDLPLGPPNLMMALTKDGQLDEQLAQSNSSNPIILFLIEPYKVSKLIFCIKMDAGMEKCFGVSSEKERDRRAYMTGPQYGIHPLANGVGSGLKIKLRETSVQTAPQ